MNAALEPTRAALRPITWLPSGRVDRVSLSSAVEDKLFFAQVREDPRVEIDGIQARASDTVVVVGSGGCTALSLLGAGAGEVHAVDTNRSQNHLTELKTVALRELARHEAIGFLGGSAMPGRYRLARYGEMRQHLHDDTAAYWDARASAIEGGVINAGVSERFIRLVCYAVRNVVHRPGLVERMLDCRTLDAQRALFDEEWNTAAWRALFTVLLNRWSMSRAYDPRFFEKIGRVDFAEHFRQLAKHALTEIPVADNYFLHQMLTGFYPTGYEQGVPPYLGESGADVIASRQNRLLIVDGSITQHLGTLADRSVHGFALSNVCEWMDQAGIDELFAEVDRVAAPGARIVFRNFVGWTELPPGIRRLEEDHSAGPALLRGDRSVVQSRVVICRARASR